MTEYKLGCLSLHVGLGSQTNLCLMEMRDRRTDGMHGPFREGDWGRPWHLHANENNHGKYVNPPDCGWLRQTVLFQKGQMLLWVITYGNWIHLTITTMARHLTRACALLCTQSHIRGNHEWPFLFPSSGYEDVERICLRPPYSIFKLVKTAEGATRVAPLKGNNGG